MTASVEQKRTVKEREVFMVALFQDAARSQAGLIGSYQLMVICPDAVSENR